MVKCLLSGSMKQHIVYTINKKSGGTAEIKIVPDVEPGINGRTSITGNFRLFYVIPNGSSKAIEADMETYMAFAGNLTFLNENFFEWRYNGQAFSEMEIAQLVKIVQDHAEEWFDEADNQPVLKKEDLQDPESALYMSDEQLAAIMEHPLYDISPYFLFGSADDVVGIVQHGDGFDVHINGAIAARLEVATNGETRLISGCIPEPALLTEIVRRVTAIRNL